MKKVHLEKKTIIPVALLLIVIFAIFLVKDTTQTNQRYDEAIKKAENALQNRYYNEAVTYYQQAIIADKKHPNPYIALSNIYISKHDYTNASLILQDALETTKTSTDISIALGNIYAETNKYDEAIRILNKADKNDTNDTNNTEVKLKLAEVYYKNNEPNKAIDIINRIENNKQAQYLSSIYTIFSDPADSLNILNNTIFENEELKVKKEALKKALEVEKSDYQTLLISKELIAQGFPALAIPELSKILEQKNNYRDVYLVLGSAYFENKQLDKALETWITATQIDPVYGETYYLISQYYYNQDNLVRAQEYGEKAVYFEKSNPTFYEFLAKIYNKQGNCSKKLETQEKIVNQLNLWQSSDNLFNNQAILVQYYLDCDEIQKALSISDKLKNSNTPKEMESQIVDLHLWVNWIINQNSEFSLGGYAQFLEQYPYYPLGHYHYGKILESVGNTIEAKKEIDRAYDLDLSRNVPKKDGY